MIPSCHGAVHITSQENENSRRIFSLYCYSIFGDNLGLERSRLELPPQSCASPKVVHRVLTVSSGTFNCYLIGDLVSCLQLPDFCGSWISFSSLFLCLNNYLGLERSHLELSPKVVHRVLSLFHLISRCSFGSVRSFICKCCRLIIRKFSFRKGRLKNTL